MPVQVAERLDRCECFVSRLRIVVAEVVVVGVRLLVEVLARKTGTGTHASRRSTYYARALVFRFRHNQTQTDA
jgi:hypothetical protein